MLILKKHTVYEKPPANKQLLMLIDIGDKKVWIVGDRDNEYKKHTVVEWYELPHKTKIAEDFSYHQMRMEEFWNNI